MKYKLLLTLLLIVVSMQGVFALNGNIYFVDDNSKKFPIPNNHIEVSFSNGDKITTETDEEGSYSLNPNQVFCWENCNFVPKIKSNSLLIKEENVLIKYSISSFIENFEDYGEEVYVDVNAPKIGLASDMEADVSEYLPKKAYKISLNFSINIEGLKQYSLNAYKIKLIDNKDKELEFESKNGENKEFLFELEGEKQYFIEYYYLIDGNEPTLRFSDDGESFEEVDKNEIYIKNGNINKIESIGPAIRAFAVIPEPELPPFSLSSQCQFFNDNPSSSSYDPILLVHGFHGDDSDYWGHIPSKFIDDDFKVYQVIYSPANNDNRYNAYLLKQCVDGVKQHASSSKVNLVGHSMGGLVSRVYTSGLGRTSSGNQLFYGNDVNHLVTIGSPLYGSYALNKLVEGDFTLRQLYKSIQFTEILDSSNYFYETFDEPSYHDLSVGSALTWNLNEKGLNNNIKYLAISGIADDVVVINLVYEESDDSDSVVSASSASLRNFQISLVLLQLNHANEHGKSAFPGFPWCSSFSSTCNINNLVNGISSFLKDESQSSVKNNFDLSFNEYYISSDISITDTPPHNEGMVLIRFEGENVCSTCAKLRRNSIDYPLVKNIDTGVFTYYSGNINQKGTTLPTGNYGIYVNGQDTGQDIEIKQLRTNVYEISLNNCIDNDSDGYGQNCALGNDCNDANDIIYPNRGEMCNNIDDDCDSSIDEGLVCVSNNYSFVLDWNLGNFEADVNFEGVDYHMRFGSYNYVDKFCFLTINRGVDQPNGDRITLKSGFLNKSSKIPLLFNTIKCDTDNSKLEFSVHFSPLCVDLDSDGHGQNCNLGNDCNDNNPQINSNAQEKCDNVDNDCDGQIDEGNVCVKPTAGILFPLNNSVVNESDMLVRFNVS